MNVKFRVWCHNKDEWEKDYMSVSQNGQLIDIMKNKPVKHDTHTIQMFTGLHDKAGKEIYEGDIIDLGDIGGKHFGICSIKYEALTAGYHFLFKGGTTWQIYDFQRKNKMALDYCSKIIGNTVENPELIKE